MPRELELGTQLVRAPVPLAAKALQEPGPIRAAALASMAASLRQDIGLCSDRARAAMARALDKAIDAAEEARRR